MWPAGPYYWVMHTLGVPGWLSQRLWLGSILLLAALGVLYLMRTLHVRGPGVPVAMVLFMLSPYILNFADRASVLLLPMAGLPWMLGLTIHALRDDEGRGWKYPAIFALVVVTVGSINLSALIYVGVAPVLWIVYSVVVTRELRWRRGLMTCAQDRCALDPRVAVVDRGARRRARRRRHHPRVHRDVPGRGAHVVGRGGAARPRVLVLLRPREARSTRRGERSVHPGHLAHRGELLDPGARDVRRPRGSAGATGCSSCCSSSSA